MFDIGWSELLVIIVVAIVVVGPKDLPRLMGTFGHYAGKLRRAASDFQRQFNEAMRETEIAEVKQAMEAVRAETESLDKPVMLPKLDTPPATPTPPIPEASTLPPAAAPAAIAAPVAPAAVAEAATRPKPPRKSAASTKPKSAGTRRKKQAEPPHDA
ncbi:MAG TPA: Sec-independent protein translocase protein TatB [Methyloceanibacter sp.]|jgi:sec-independent protein translocase protein TatB|nr:Sec-independent protein translocase protein TatB [Methyloceanibacter sp.]